MDDLARLKKLIPDSPGYTDPDLNSLLLEHKNIYRAAAEVLRSVVSKIVAGTFSFSSGAQGGGVKVDKTKLVENYRLLIEEYELRAETAPADEQVSWRTDIDRLTGEDYTDYAH